MMVTMTLIVVFLMLWILDILVKERNIWLNIRTRILRDR